MRIRQTLLALACGLGLVPGALADEAGVVRITDQGGPTVRAQSAGTVAPVSHEWDGGYPIDEGYVDGGYVDGGYGDGFIGGPEVMGGPGCQPWCMGAGYGPGCYDSCCCCEVCPSCPGITGNPVLDAPTKGLCELFLCIFSKCKPCKKCPKCRGGYGAYGYDAYGRACRPSGTKVYAVDPNHFDARDGRVYSAAGYGIPMAVPLAPTVSHTYNYGWGIPSSRVTPVSRPNPY